MLNLKKYSHFFLFVGLAIFASSCEKRDANLTTDFESKKASADKLVTEVNEGLTRIDAEHADMMGDLDSAGKASKDSSKVKNVQEEMTRHMEQEARVKALVDSVSVYKAMTAENDEQMRAANDKLGTHFDDLSNEWKTYQDQHAKLQQDIQSFAVNAAGDAVIDSAKVANSGNSGTGLTPGKTGTPAQPSKNSGGTPRKSSGGTTTGGVKQPANNSGGTPRKSQNGTTTQPNDNAPIQQPAGQTGGTPRKSSGSSTTK